MQLVKISLICSAAMISLVGCASEVMKEYVGASVTEVMLDYGRPTDVFDLGDGRRAYQWAVNSSGVMPMTSPSYATVYANGGMATVTSTSTTYVPYSQNCLYTFTAVQRDGDWIIDGFRQPDLMCE